jgi:hypothetical protein
VSSARSSPPPLHRSVYREALRALRSSRIPFLVSGAFAMSHYARVWRATKDLDVFLEREHVDEALAALAGAGFDVELTDAKWLAKARREDVYIDLIFAAGNLIGVIDRSWFDRARVARVLGTSVLLVAPEDLISFKAFICERHRFDGADIAHMILGLEGRLDWAHLLARMGEHWELLFFHLMFFRYVYPRHRSMVPAWLMDELVERLRRDDAAKAGFRGTLVSIESFERDVERGYGDPRQELRDDQPARAA